MSLKQLSTAIYQTLQESAFTASPLINKRRYSLIIFQDSRPKCLQIAVYTEVDCIITFRSVSAEKWNMWWQVDVCKDKLRFGWVDGQAARIENSLNSTNLTLPAICSSNVPAEFRQSTVHWPSSLECFPRVCEPTELSWHFLDTSHNLQDVSTTFLGNCFNDILWNRESMCLTRRNQPQKIEILWSLL